MLAPGETVSYRIEAKAGQLIHIVVDQRGIDIVASLFGVDEDLLIRSDRAIDDIGPEPLLALAELAGSYRLQIEAPRGDYEPGRCIVRVEEFHLASNQDRQRAEAASTFFRARLQTEPPAAIDLYHSALKAWQDLGDKFWIAECTQRLGREHYRLREWQEATRFFEQAADLYRASGDARLEAITRNYLGLIYRNQWNIERAVQSYLQVLPLWQTAGDRSGEALTMFNLAQAFQYQDEVQQALEYYTRGLELFTSKDRYLLARAVHNLGVLHRDLGQVEEARERLQEAEQIGIEVKHPTLAASLLMLAEIHQSKGELDEAFDYIQRALTLRRDAGNRRGEGIALSALGRAHQARGELDKALELSLEARDILHEERYSYSEATVLKNLGSLYIDRKQPEEARDCFRQALELYRLIGDLTGEAESLLGVAAAERRLGELSAALEASQEALALFESVRPKAIRHEHRASFFSTVQEHFESHIDLLMALHRLDGDAGYDARALFASERARARSLLDLLSEAEAGIRAGTAPELLAREKEVQRRLNTREFRLLTLRNDPNARPEDLAVAQEAVDLGLEELEQLWVAIRTRDPRYAALTETPIPSLPEIQSQILDEGTVLLEYRLGQDRSFLWAVTRDALTSYVLPGRLEIERLATSAYERLQDSHRTGARTSSRYALCELAEQILRPVESQLAGKRVLVVSDGALLYIPVAVLPALDDAEQCLSAPPLVTRHEIIHLPSISTLSLLRRDLQDRSPSKYRIAVVADPVFEADDNRLEALAGVDTQTTAAIEDPAAMGRSDEGVKPRSFSRLPFSEEEARAILALVPEAQRFSALGFDANKETVTSGRLAEYRIVHFATHGILDTEQPNLSKIVLSQIDRRGRTRDGYLRTHEIYNLKLPCDLVVLSACQTALGREVRGEGLVGLTRGFMYAGAERVMVSLWNVDDQSTAVLMERFYRGLFEQGLQPAAALQQAQISMWRDPKWSAPFHWAGFVIQGDWH